MYSFVCFRAFSWLTNLPAAEGGLAKKSVLIRAIRGKKKQPQAAFQYDVSGLFLELAGFFEVPDQHIYSQQGPQHDPQPHIAAGFIVAGQFGVIE